MAAGAATKKGVIGYVVPYGIPEVVRHLNAFTLGAQATHPGAKVKIVWTNAWFSPPKETAAAKALVSAGADVLGQNVDSPAAGVYAEKAGVPWVGYDSDAKKFAPKQWLTAAVYDWGPYYVRRVKAAINGTWKPGFYYGSVKDGFTSLAAYGPEGLGEDEGRDRREEAADPLRKVALVLRSDLRPERQAEAREGQVPRPEHEGGDRRAVLDAVAREGRGRLRLPRPASGLGGWGSRPRTRQRQREAPVTPAPLRLWPMRGITKRFPGVLANDRVDFEAAAGRGARAARRERGRQEHALEHPHRSLPAGRGVDQPVRRGGPLRLAERRDRRGHRHGAPALPPRAAVHGRREHHPRRAPAGGAELRRQPASDRARRGGSRRAVRDRRRSACARLAALRRRAAARRDPEGPLPRGADPDPRRADRRAHAAGGGVALRHACAG